VLIDHRRGHRSSVEAKQRVNMVRGAKVPVHVQLAAVVALGRDGDTERARLLTVGVGVATVAGGAAPLTVEVSLMSVVHRLIVVVDRVPVGVVVPAIGNTALPVERADAVETGGAASRPLLLDDAVLDGV